MLQLCIIRLLPILSSCAHTNTFTPLPTEKCETETKKISYNEDEMWQLFGQPSPIVNHYSADVNESNRKFSNSHNNTINNCNKINSKNYVFNASNLQEQKEEQEEEFNEQKKMSTEEDVNLTNSYMEFDAPHTYFIRTSQHDTGPNNFINYDKLTEINWLAAISAYEAECYTHPSNPNKQVSHHLIRCISYSLEQPRTRNERHVCELWKYALGVHRKLTVQPNDSIAMNNMEETLWEVKEMAKILYYAHQYKSCVAFVHHNLPSLEQVMERILNTRGYTNTTSTTTNTTSENIEASKHEYKQCDNFPEQTLKQINEQSEEHDVNSVENVKCIIVLMELFSVYLMSLSQHEPWVWHMERDNEAKWETSLETCNTKNNLYEENLTSLLEEEKQEYRLLSKRHEKENFSETTSLDKLQRVCEFAINLLYHIHKNQLYQMDKDNLNLTRKIDTASFNTFSNNTNNTEQRLEVLQGVGLLLWALEWFMNGRQAIGKKTPTAMFHISANHHHHEGRKAISTLLSNEIVKQWRSITDLFESISLNLMQWQNNKGQLFEHKHLHPHHMYHQHERHNSIDNNNTICALNIPAITHKQHNMTFSLKTPLLVWEWVVHVPLSSWHDWKSLVQLYNYVVECEVAWPNLRLFQLSITIANKLISWTAPWATSLTRQREMNEIKRHVLDEMGTSLDVHTLVQYGNVCVNEYYEDKMEHNSKDKSNDTNHNSGKTSIVTEYNTINNINDNNNSREPDTNEKLYNYTSRHENTAVHVNVSNKQTSTHAHCLSVVCSMSGLEAYKGVQELLRHAAKDQKWAELQEIYGDMLTGNTKMNWKTSLDRLEQNLAEGHSSLWRSELAHTLRLLSDANKSDEFFKLIREYNAMEGVNTNIVTPTPTSTTTITTTTAVTGNELNHCKCYTNHNLCVASALSNVIERSGKWWYVGEVATLIANASLPQNDVEEFFLENACLRSFEALAHGRQWDAALMWHRQFRSLLPEHGFHVLCSMLVKMPATSSWRNVLLYINSLLHKSQEVPHQHLCTTSNCSAVRNSLLNDKTTSHKHSAVPVLISHCVNGDVQKHLNINTRKKEEKELSKSEEEEEEEEYELIKRSLLPEPYLTELLAAHGKVCVSQISDFQLRRKSLRLLSDNGHRQIILRYIHLLTFKSSAFNNAKIITEKGVNGDGSRNEKFIMHLWSLLLYALMHCNARERESVEAFLEIPLYKLASFNLVTLQTALAVAQDYGWLNELLYKVDEALIEARKNMNNNEEVTENYSSQQHMKMKAVRHAIHEYKVFLSYVLHGELPAKSFTFTNTYVIHTLYSLIETRSMVIRASIPYSLRKQIAQHRLPLSKQVLADTWRVSVLAIGALPSLDAITQSVKSNNAANNEMCRVSIFTPTPLQDVDARSVVYTTVIDTHSMCNNILGEQDKQVCSANILNTSSTITTTTNTNNNNNNNNNTNNKNSFSEMRECESIANISTCLVNKSETSAFSKNNFVKKDKQEMIIVIGYKPPAADMHMTARGLINYLHLSTKPHLPTSSSLLSSSSSLLEPYRNVFYSMYYIPAVSHGLFVLCHCLIPRQRFTVTLHIIMELAPIASVHVALLSSHFFTKYQMTLYTKDTNNVQNTVNVSREITNENDKNDEWHFWEEEEKSKLEQGIVPSSTVNCKVNEMNVCNDNGETEVNTIMNEFNTSFATTLKNVTESNHHGVLIRAICEAQAGESINNAIHHIITDMNNEGWGLIESDPGAGEFYYIQKVILRDQFNPNNVIVAEYEGSNKNNQHCELTST